MTRRTRFALSILASSALVAPASANTILFSTATLPDGATLPTGAAPGGPVTVTGGVTQIATPDGDVVSFVGNGSFDASGSTVQVTSGRVTLSGGADGRASLNFGGNVSANVAGQSAAASFSVDAGNILSGRGLGGTVSVTANGVTRSFDLGQAFAAAAGAVPRPIATPGAAPIAAAIAIPDPVTPTDQSVTGDVTTGTPLNLTTLPATNALTTFEALAALRGTFGGYRFPGVTTAFFDVNLASVRAGQALGAFTPAAGAAATNAYLSAIRSGTSPSAATTNAAYQAALLGYFGADGLPSGTSQATRDLLARYQEVIAAGGSAAGFSAASLAASLSAWQRYLAAGGNPATYTAATSALIAAYNQAFSTLGAGNAAAADIANIEAQRALQAALGANANLSIPNAAAILSAYFGSLGTANVVTSGLTNAQLQALLNYYNAQSTGIATDAAAAASIANYQSFIAGGGTFGQPTTPTSVGRIGVAFLSRPGGYGFAIQTPFSSLPVVPVTVDSAGNPTSFFDNRVRVGTATLANAQSGAGWRIGRYVNGTLLVGGTAGSAGSPQTVTLAGEESYLFALADVVPSIARTTGTATYGFAAMTPLVANVASEAITNSSLTGGVALAFGTAPRWGAAGVLGMTLGSERRVIQFASPGGLTAPSLQAEIQGTSINLQGSIDGQMVQGACGSSCSIFLQLRTGGTESNILTGRIGTFVYEAALAATTDTPVGATTATVPVATLSPLPTRTGPLTGVRSDFTTGTYVGSFGNAAGLSSFAPRQVEFDASGEPRRSLGAWNLETAAIGNQHLRQNDWLMARYLLNGQHRLDTVVMRPLTVAIPLTGRAEFQIIGNLDIVSQRADVTYVSSLLDGRMSLAFGTTPQWGMDAGLRLGYANGGVDIYRFGSAASFTNPTGTTQYNQANGELRTGSAAFDVIGPDCGTGCGGSLNFALGGSIGNLFGGTFRVSAAGNPLFFGSAMAQQVATGSTVAPTGVAGRNGVPTGSGGTTGGTTTPPVATAFAVIRPEGQNSTQATLQTAGGVLTAYGLNLENGATSVTRRGTATAEGGSSPTQAIGWTRWFGGRATTELSTGGMAPDDISAAGGRHFIWGTRATNLPTTGTANYDIIGATRVTTTDDRPLGTVDTATLRASFGSTTRVGVDLGVTVAGQSYAVGSVGGVATPNLTVAAATMEFVGDATVTGNGCTSSSCSGTLRGLLAGDGASHAGVAFTFPLATGRSASANGVVAFARRP